MVIVAGHVIVGGEERDDYLAGCAQVVEQARSAPGCLDFAISADLLDPTRINVFERWDSENAVESFSRQRAQRRAGRRHRVGFGLRVRRVRRTRAHLEGVGNVGSTLDQRGDSGETQIP